MLTIRITLLFSALCVVLHSCSPQSEDLREKWKREIVEAERQFAEMAASEGIPQAFLTFADSSAVLMRANTLVIGIEAMRERFGPMTTDTSSTLTWSPDFVDVSESGDLGYTYGKFVATSVDSLGTVSKNEGIVHTVWKRQKNGSWKYVWD